MPLAGPAQFHPQLAALSGARSVIGSSWGVKRLAPPTAHYGAASLTPSSPAAPPARTPRSNSSRLIHSSTVCTSFWPAPKVTVGMPWRTIQLASSPPLVARMFGRAAARRHRGGRALHHGQRVLHAERVIVGLHLELDAAGLALAVLHRLRGLLERRLVGGGDLLEELRRRGCGFRRAHARSRSRRWWRRPPGRPSPPVTGPTLLVPCFLPFTTLPNQPPALHLGERQREDHRREMPRSGAPPACEARPKISTSQRSAPTAPTTTLAAERPSKLKAITGRRDRPGRRSARPTARSPRAR